MHRFVDAAIGYSLATVDWWWVLLPYDKLSVTKTSSRPHRVCPLDHSSLSPSLLLARSLVRPRALYLSSFLYISLSQTNVVLLLALDPRVTIAAIEADMAERVRQEVIHRKNVQH